MNQKEKQEFKLACVQQASYLVPSIRSILNDKDVVPYTPEEKCDLMLKLAEIIYTWTEK